MDVDTAQQPRNVISFCSGYAGIERGLELAGLELRTLSYVEIEAFAIANLVAKMEAGSLVPAPVWSNLKTFPSHLFRDRVDILTAGYPCQPFSAAGKRAGKDDPRHLWPYIREHIAAMRPVRCLFENVEGHISLGLREVIEDLESLGYKTAWGIFSAAEVGAPHQRKRVYILADSDSERWAKHDRKQGSSSKGKRTDTGRGQTIRSGATGAVADSKSQRVQGLRASRKQESDSHGQARLPMCESERRKHAYWDAEPGLGRVVDGGADRVDRLRLLGNGVVPQTAAQAWTVLEGQLWQT